MRGNLLPITLLLRREVVHGELARILRKKPKIKAVILGLEVGTRLSQPTSGNDESDKEESDEEAAPDSGDGGDRGQLSQWRSRKKGHFTGRRARDSIE